MPTLVNRCNRPHPFNQFIVGCILTWYAWQCFAGHLVRLEFCLLPQLSDGHSNKGALTRAAMSASVKPKDLASFIDLMISRLALRSSFESPVERKTFPSLFSEIITTSFSGAILEATEFGVLTGTASEGLNFVVRIKNDKSKKPHHTLQSYQLKYFFRAIFGLAIVSLFKT